MNQRIKRLFDVSMASLLLVLLSPLLLAVALTIKLCHPRVPLIIGMWALGKGRQPFKVWKFSTMVGNADQLLAEVLERDPELRREWHDTAKLKRDPRVLPLIGNALRRSSLNELPQLFNVLAGEMSLVGPRPITEPEEALYASYSGPEWLALRYSVRPGITGLWQVSGRSDVTYRERVELDHRYLTHPSFLEDLRILAVTVVKVLRCAGAY